MTARSRSSSCAPPPAAALVSSRAARAPNYSGLPRSPCSETCSASSTFTPTRGTRPARRRRAVTGSAALPPPSSSRRRRRRTRSRTLRPCSWLAAALASLRILWPQRKPQWRRRMRSSARQWCRSWRRATRPCSTCRTDGSRWTSCRRRPSGRKSNQRFKPVEPVYSCLKGISGSYCFMPLGGQGSIASRRFSCWCNGCSIAFETGAAERGLHNITGCVRAGLTQFEGARITCSAAAGIGNRKKRARVCGPR
mmetsp:Transcript_8461/g.19765  ORF Transcript_8461/g.19765 Transcript_8461/m.19765 type:complete len:252 (-) Transcript_8461:596-1351(-)